jgi:hypothetical protein
MLVYHGSYVEVVTPDLERGRVRSDFGKGFYVTTLQRQAEKWAIRQTNRILKKKPTANAKTVISVYEFNIDDLNIFTYDGYTEEWLEFVVKNRDGKFEPHEYDAIYGNIADDDVVTVVNDYARLLRIGRVSEKGKAFYLEQLQFSQPNNQYCIATQKGIDSMQFIESYLHERG